MADEHEQATTATQVALLRQDFGHMSEDIAEMKADFKDFKRFYYTKEEAAYMRTELLTAHNSLANQFASWKKFVISVGVIVVASLILAALKLSFPAL